MYQDVPLVEKHRRLLLRKMGASIEFAGITNAVFKSLVAHISPRFSAFAALTVAISAFKEKDFGVFPDYESVWLPTTVFDDIHCVQYRTDVMQTVYEAIVPVCLSDLTRNCLQAALELHGLQVLFLCNGGFLIGEIKNIRAFSGSLDHVRRERVYSVAAMNRYPIQLVSGFDRMPDSTDLCPEGAERRLFQDIERMFCML